MTISLVQHVFQHAYFASQFIQKYNEPICTNLFNQLQFKPIDMVVITHYLKSKNIEPNIRQKSLVPGKKYMYYVFQTQSGHQFIVGKIFDCVLMWTNYTTYDDAPEELKREMLNLLHLKSNIVYN